jgi:hypothetical protein
MGLALTALAIEITGMWLLHRANSDSMTSVIPAIVVHVCPLHSRNNLAFLGH